MQYERSIDLEWKSLSIRKNTTNEMRLRILQKGNKRRKLLLKMND